MSPAFLQQKAPLAAVSRILLKLSTSAYDRITRTFTTRDSEMEGFA